ncbi:hypothetical protein ABLB69_19700 [Xenorhabdus khoisanae]|uniref:hypothetical protein n=1 Tax=Xenorhabdus khoisanae TaxID=880157 RepID=UPI0032B835F1
MIFRLSYFFRAAQFLRLVAFIVTNQFPHPELNLTELVLLALVLLLDGVGVITVRNEHQTARHNLHGQGATFIEPGRYAGCLLPAEPETVCG